MSSLPNYRNVPGRFPSYFNGPRIPDSAHLTDSEEAELDRLANLEAEQKVLGALLIDDCRPEDRLAILSIIKEPEYFFRDAHQKIFRGMRDLIDAGKEYDLTILAEHLESRGVLDQCGGDDYLGVIAGSVPGSVMGPHHAEIVRAKWTVRLVQRAAAEQLQDVRSQLYTPAELIDRLAGTLRRIESETASEEEDDASGFHPWPDAPDPAVWHGVAGQLVQAIEPFTEADPMAILGQFLVCFGNLLGRGPHWRYERTRHGLNLFLCLVGESGEGRKGSSWGHVTDLLEQVAPEWKRKRIMSGMSTGEGLIHQVRDPVVKMIRNPATDVVEEKEIDGGVDDKRVLFVESEFGGLLTTMSRDGYNTSAVIRQAWDGGDLRVSNKNSPSNSTGAHVSIIGHITPKELRQKLNSTESANGFGNRFLWTCCKRSKVLPHGGDVDRLDLGEFVHELRAVVHHVESPLRPPGPIRRSPEANRLWEEVYLSLTGSGGKSGLVCDLTARAAPQVMRIASLYAVFDRSMWIAEEHLRAALAFWKYSEQSASWIFGDYVSDPDGEAVLKALQENPEGLTRTQINRKCFAGHKPAEELKQLLHRLVKDGRIEPPGKASPDAPEARVAKGASWTLKKRNTPDAARNARYGGIGDASVVGSAS